jgi:hypothetical protein
MKRARDTRKQERRIFGPYKGSRSGEAGRSRGSTCIPQLVPERLNYDSGR